MQLVLFISENTQAVGPEMKRSTHYIGAGLHSQSASIAYGIFRAVAVA